MVSKRTVDNIMHMHYNEFMPCKEIARHISLSVYLIRKILKEEVKHLKDEK